VFGFPGFRASLALARGQDVLRWHPADLP
jgi:hypothetical protein